MAMRTVKAPNVRRFLGCVSFSCNEQLCRVLLLSLSRIFCLFISCHAAVLIFLLQDHLFIKGRRENMFHRHANICLLSCSLFAFFFLFLAAFSLVNRHKRERRGLTLKSELRRVLETKEGGVTGFFTFMI